MTRFMVFIFVMPVLLLFGLPRACNAVGGLSGGWRVGAYQVDFGHLKWDFRQSTNVSAVAWPANWKDYISTWQRIERLDLTLPDGQALRFDHCQAWVTRRGNTVTHVSIAKILGPIEDVTAYTRSYMWACGLDTADLDTWLAGMQRVQPERIRIFKPQFSQYGPDRSNYFEVKTAGSDVWTSRIGFGIN